MSRATRLRASSDPMLRIVRLYLESGGAEPIDLDVLARFAIKGGHWESHPKKILQLCKRDFSRAFREQYHVDDQGREVRTFHAAKSHDTSGEQKVLWADMRTAPLEHMEVAFQQRRGQIVGDCRQLKRDIDSFNENNRFGATYQLSLDFTEDIAELEQPTTYQPNKPR